ncbi:class II fructose-bisphosphate aldolase [Streptococcus dysgalactiae]|uniref:class II fructose-bisphosphate aldolase n=1 Tax=Streptococcus dysgalactiae TaxID=1334 RepID=UPI001CF386D4|nr:class II fructose-bisphosphate aldolase [Streptococcus dysgalactiae]MCB2828650.1 class II fructose-bisphosphate aldolase [Streptococcus dysgalactiae subsp. dysgalactiae]MCB2831224.1 class II fructose-bisphosphate aldolase [Streptococcus dysgalactiae subsp. dysgalactiae]MCB2836481.1 class II fructose-bisphosphate aldolase [Streptococcus dysgalactiae subsp. dysgalactiae]MCB2838491.1 class II fructose-bisphosphate aldolase [Streptococcus dysgalactiae subsp. dysgalactiae]MCB2842164.1 class II f
MKADMSQVLQTAKACHYAVPAMNYIDFASARAYAKISEKRKLPLILAFAQSHSQWLPLEEAALIGYYFQQTLSTPVVLHLDHGQDSGFIKKAIDLGFNSVMIDASLDSFDENVKKTREIVDYARARGVAVEAEIGFVGANANQENHRVTDSIYTSLEDAKLFYEQTLVDALAISIGTAHGIYRGQPKLNFERLTEIAAALPIPLVLHGGSSSGDDNLARCAREGISKINIFSDVIVAAYQHRLDSKITDYPSLMSTMQVAMEKVLDHYYDVFGTRRGGSQ